ncbi:MAG: hypothetical protein AAGB07_15350 [Pseudomonadota bacterium]
MRKLGMFKALPRVFILLGVVMLIGGVTPICGATHSQPRSADSTFTQLASSEQWCCCGGCCGWAINCNAVPGCTNC